MIADMAARKLSELTEVQILYLIAFTSGLMVTEAWALALGFVLVQLSELCGLVLMRRVRSATSDPRDGLERFAAPLVFSAWMSAFALSTALALAMLNAEHNWHVSIAAIWCIATVYFVFPTIYCVRALYGSILIHCIMMAAVFFWFQVDLGDWGTGLIVANLGLAVFAGAAAAFIGRQVRRDYLFGLAREQTLGKTVRDLDREIAEKSDFVGQLSHELRTPLNGLMGMAALTRRECEDPTQAQRLDIMLQSGASLVQLLNDSLDLNRLEADALELTTSANSLRNLIEEQAHLYSANAAQKGLRLSTATAPNVPDLLLFDRLRVMQCVGNLISNAVKFSNRGTIRVRAEYWDTESAPIVAITVSDEGIGIPEDLQDAIFNPYSRAQGAAARSYPGAGLGLAIGRRLAHLMGGDLTVKSREDQGAVFTFTFVSIALPGSGF